MEFRNFDLSATDEQKPYFTLLQRLRPHLSWDEFQNLYEVSHQRDNYTIVGLFSENQLVALMGYRILYDFVHGKHLYVDDLITDPAYRSQGFGSRLLSHARERARELGCDNLRLCTGTSNEGAKRFYEREGWELRSVVYKLKLNTKS